MDFTIAKDHPDLLKYAISLQSKNSDALGFLPRTIVEREAQLGRMFLGLLNGEPCGYILAGSGWQGVLRHWQVCIQYDARRRLYGLHLWPQSRITANRWDAHRVLSAAPRIWKQMSFGQASGIGSLGRNRAESAADHDGPALISG